MRLSELSYEKFATYFYIAAVTFTIFAPAVHYVGYVLTLGFLLYGKIRHGAPLFSFGVGTQRAISLILTLFFLWSAFINVFLMTDFMAWGKGASVYLEMLLGFLFATRLFHSPASRRLFIKSFVSLTIIIFCLIIVNNYFPLPIPLPKRLAMNGNTLGLYPILAMPYIFCYAFWAWEKLYIRKDLAVIASLATLFISFASGAWITALFILPFIFYYGVKDKEITDVRNAAATLMSAFLLLVVINSLSEGFLLRRFEMELLQITGINNVERLTNNRSKIWHVASTLIAERPLTGHGRENFEELYRQALKENPAFSKFGTTAFDHAHNTYLELAFSSGIPSALLFIFAMFLMIRKSWRGRFYFENGIPWNLIFLSMICGQLIYGLTGDVFEARRDLAVIFWCSMGIAAALPEPQDSASNSV